MTNFEFKPIGDASDQLRVPLYENASADIAPYYASTKTVERAKQDVLDNLHRLGANGYFQEGEFVINKQKRRGYVLWFTQDGQRGRMLVAGLPMATPTDVKLNKVRVQALLNLADWLKGAITTQIFSPGANPLIPFMLVDANTTVSERYANSEGLALPAPRMDVVDVIVEVVKP